MRHLQSRSAPKTALQMAAQRAKKRNKIYARARARQPAQNKKKKQKHIGEDLLSMALSPRELFKARSSKACANTGR